VATFIRSKLNTHKQVRKIMLALYCHNVDFVVKGQYHLFNHVLTPFNVGTSLWQG